MAEGQGANTGGVASGVAQGQGQSTGTQQATQGSQGDRGQYIARGEVQTGVADTSQQQGEQGDQGTDIDFRTFDMMDDNIGELSEYKFESLENLMKENNLEMTDDVRIEMNKYKTKAKELGLNAQQFSEIANLFTETMMDGTVKSKKGEAEALKNNLLKMKAEMTMDERKSYKPLIAKAEKTFGEDVAKKIGTDMGLYRAFLTLATRGGSSVDGVKAAYKDPNATAKSESELRTERADKLRYAIGDRAKTDEIFKEYSTKYPQFFKD